MKILNLMMIPKLMHSCFCEWKILRYKGVISPKILNKIFSQDVYLGGQYFSICLKYIDI